MSSFRNLQELVQLNRHRYSQTSISPSERDEERERERGSGSPVLQRLAAVARDSSTSLSTLNSEKRALFASDDRAAIQRSQRQLEETRGRLREVQRNFEAVSALVEESSVVKQKLEDEVSELKERCMSLHTQVQDEQKAHMQSAEESSAKIENLSTQLANTVRELDQVQSNMEGYKQRELKAEREIEVLRRENEGLREVRETLKRRMEDLEKSLSHSRHEHTEAISQLRVYRSDVEALQARVEREKEVERGRKEEEESEHRKQLAGKIARLQTELELHRKASAEKEEGWKRRVESVKAEGEKRLAESKENAQREKRLLAQMLKEQKVASDERETALKEKHIRSVGSLSANLDRSRADLQGEKREHVQTREDLRRCEGDLQRCRSELEEVSEEKEREKLKAVGEVRDRLEETRVEVRDLKDKIRVLERLHLDSQASATGTESRYRVALTEAKQREDMLRGEVVAGQDLKRRLELLDKENKRLEERFHSSESQVHQLAHTLDSTQIRLMAATEEREAVCEAWACAKEKMRAAVDALERARNWVEERESALESTVERLIFCESASESALTCMKCMQLYQNPVMLIPCGHTMCESCFHDVMNDHSGDFYCIECGNGMHISDYIHDQSLNLVSGKHTYKKQTLDSVIELCRQRVEIPSLRELLSESLPVSPPYRKSSAQKMTSSEDAGDGPAIGSSHAADHDPTGTVDNNPTPAGIDRTSTDGSGTGASPTVDNPTGTGASPTVDNPTGTGDSGENSLHGSPSNASHTHSET